MGIPVYVICCFSLVDLIFLSVWLVYILVCCSSSGLSCLGLSYWIWVTVSFPMLRKFSTILFLNIFSGPKPSGTPIMQTLVHLMLSQRSLKLSSFHYLFFFFILFCGSDFHDFLPAHLSVLLPRFFLLLILLFSSQLLYSSTLVLYIF